MFSLTSSYYIAYDAKACDMRNRFDSLCGLVRDELNRNPISGEVFVLMNRLRNTIQLLHGERGRSVI